MSDLAGDGFTIDTSGVDLALNKMAKGEQMLADLVEKLRSYVIVPGYENWNDPYGDKLLGTIDALVTDLDQTLDGVLKLDADYRKAVNKLLRGTTAQLLYTETPSLER